MKAFLLAAGLGTRLRPLTNDIPKCLVPINGKPLLSYWLQLLEKNGVTEVLINLHHLADKVIAFLNSWPTSLIVHTYYEKHLLGSAGTVWMNRHWTSDQDCFLIAYADNLTNFPVKKMLDFHQQARPPLTMGLFITDRPHECGIAAMDHHGTIIDFQEKPEYPKTNYANAGIYVAENNILNLFPGSMPLDFGFDILPLLVGQMKGYIINDYLMDIGNMERYQQAQIDASSLKF